jgi:hypothetical protein
MPDIASISAILSSIKAASDIAKLLKDADLSLEKAELRLKLADLVSALADARIEMASVQETLNVKDQQIRELQEASRIKSQLQYEQPYYWIIDGTACVGPYCQSCYDKEQKLIRLQGYDKGHWDCKVCGNSFSDRAFRQRQDRVISDYNPYE